MDTGADRLHVSEQAGRDSGDTRGDYGTCPLILQVGFPRLEFVRLLYGMHKVVCTKIVVYKLLHDKCIG